jgi:hypothetical protein
VVPRALVPWLFPAAVILAIVLVAVLPGGVAAGVLVALFLVVVAIILARRHQWVKNHDDFERPGNRELLRSFGLLRPQNPADHTQGRSTDSTQR